MKLSDLGEFGLIARYAQRLEQRAGVVAGIGDDAAILASLQTPVVTCDALVEGVHFRRDWSSPFQLGRKAVSVNVSDLAAKGAQPVAAFITLALGRSLLDDEAAVPWLDGFYEGLESAAAQYGCTIAGGDTVRTAHETMLSLTLIGEAGKTVPPLRSQARAGNSVLVTGTLGDAAAGLFLLQHPEVEVAPETRAYLLERHLDPTARLKEAQAILGRCREQVTAAMDLSDGLAGDAAHIARRSGVQIEIFAASLPVSPQCREAARAAVEQGFAVSAQQWALSGGEDYELLWCVEEAGVASVSQGMEQGMGTLVTRIGRCVAPADSVPVVLLDEQGRREPVPCAWTHF